MYWLAITQLEAREALLEMSIADFPHTKKEPRRRFVSELRATIKDIEEYDENKIPVTIDDIEAKLRAAIGK